MTVTDVRPAESTVTPESQDLALLLKRLEDPDLAGFRTEIQESINKLRAKSALGA